jgi:tetratricopeptide (TPR) repeat protein
VSETLKDQVETALAPLIGLQLSIARRAANMRNFQFGTVRPYQGGTIGDYALHIQGAWRLENDKEILTGSADLWEWKYDERRPAHWNYHQDGNLQDAILQKTLQGYDPATKSTVNTTHLFVVERIEATKYGDAFLHLSGGYRLILFPTSGYTEAWRLFKPDTDAPHFVVGDAYRERGFALVSAIDLLERATYFSNAGELSDVIEDCTQAIQLEPENSQAYFLRGTARDDPSAHDDYAGALADYSQTIQLNPQHDEAYIARAMIYQINKENFEAAIADYTAALQVMPSSSTFLSRGWCYWRIDQNEAAIADFTQAIALEPSVDGYARRARSRREVGNLAGALEDCETALSLNAKSGFTYFQRGEVYDEMGDTDSALKDMSQAIELIPPDDEALNYRAWLYYEKGDFDLALADANAAIHLDSTAWTYFHTRGVIYAARNDVVHAIVNYQTALDLDVDDRELAQEMRDYIARWVRTSNDR